MTHRCFQQLHTCILILFLQCVVVKGHKHLYRTFLKKPHIDWKLSKHKLITYKVLQPIITAKYYQQWCHFDLIGAGYPQSKENRQEEKSGQQGAEALSEAHVEEFEAIAWNLRGNTQNLDSWHKTGTERQPDRHSWHGPSPSEEVIGTSLPRALLQSLVESDGHRDDQHDSKDDIVSQDKSQPGRLTGRPFFHDFVYECCSRCLLDLSQRIGVNRDLFFVIV